MLARLDNFGAELFGYWARMGLMSSSLNAVSQAEVGIEQSVKRCLGRSGTRMVPRVIVPR